MNFRTHYTWVRETQPKKISHPSTKKIAILLALDKWLTAKKKRNKKKIGAKKKKWFLIQIFTAFDFFPLSRVVPFFVSICNLSVCSFVVKTAFSQRKLSFGKFFFYWFFIIECRRFDIPTVCVISYCCPTICVTKDIRSTC